jgi:gliding motility-associated protein GldC
MSQRTAEIQFRVTLDESRMPARIEWSATEAPSDVPRETKCVVLTVWNASEKNVMSIDLWTKDMLVDEMKLFVWQSLLTLADTLERATREGEGATEMRRFARRFAADLNPKGPEQHL